MEPDSITGIRLSNGEVAILFIHNISTLDASVSAYPQDFSSSG